MLRLVINDFKGSVLISSIKLQISNGTDIKGVRQIRHNANRQANNKKRGNTSRFSKFDFKPNVSANNYKLRSKITLCFGTRYDCRRNSRYTTFPNWNLYEKQNNRRFNFGRRGIFCVKRRVTICNASTFKGA